MTAEESVVIQNQLSKNLQLFAELLTPSVPASTLVSNLSAACSLISRSAENSANRLLQAQSWLASDAASRYLESLKILAFQPTFEIPTATHPDMICSSISSAIEASEPYIQPEQREALDRSISCAFKGTEKRKMTLSDLIGLINLLVVIYFGIVSSMPDKQLDRIAAQNEVFIGQQFKMEQEDIALREALDALIDSLDLLTDEVESLREELESAKDEPVPERQSNAEGGQQQDGNAQN